jgi:hypothetical protein
VQQKFILLLTVIIVAVGILTGMQRAEEGSREAAKDALLQELLVLVGRAQAWYRLPAHLGGGGGSFANLTMNAVNFDSTRFIGNYVLADIKHQNFHVIGVGKQGEILIVTLEAFPDSVAIVSIVQ